MLLLNRILLAVVILTGAACQQNQDDMNDSGSLLGGGNGTAPSYEKGKVSYYGIGDGFAGKTTANGSVYNPYGVSAACAHSLKNRWIEVTNLDTRTGSYGKKAIGQCTDTGAFRSNLNRILDVSIGFLRALGISDSEARKFGVFTMEYRVVDGPEPINNDCANTLAISMPGDGSILVRVSDKCAAEKVEILLTDRENMFITGNINASLLEKSSQIDGTKEATVNYLDLRTNKVYQYVRIRLLKNNKVLYTNSPTDKFKIFEAR
jgi:hypothetical protein